MSEPPAALFSGRVFHVRLGPIPHRFAYRVVSILIDVDRLSEAGRMSRLFSVNRFNLLGFHERDHGPCDGSGLRPHVERLLAARGLSAEGCRILLLAYPRCLGVAFNPLSVYYVLDGQDRPRAVLYEVRNTFGERHTYAAAVEDGHVEALRQSARKTFRVSPFLSMNLRYDFRLSPPGEALRLHILASGPDGPALAAGFTALRRDLTSRAVVAAFAAAPLTAFKVVAAIHWEALRLWLKGVRPVAVREAELGWRRSGLEQGDRVKRALVSPLPACGERVRGSEQASRREAGVRGSLRMRR